VTSTPSPRRPPFVKVSPSGRPDGLNLYRGVRSEGSFAARQDLGGGSLFPGEPPIGGEPEVIRIVKKDTKQLVRTALEKLERALEAGKSEALRAYLRAMGRFRSYSQGNILLISWQRPSATKVAGFQTWKKLGRHVRRGERGIRILAPTIWRNGTGRQRATESDADREDEKEPLPETLAKFKTAHVFDISRTDGKELPEFARVQGDPRGSLDHLKQFAAERGIRVEYAEHLGGAEGTSRGGCICIRAGLSPAEEFSVLCHEVAHELLHHDGEQRPRRVRETEAEAVAFVVNEAVGLDANTASSDYIQLYDGNREMLLASLERIRKTAGRILESVGFGGSAPSAAEWQRPGLESQSRSSV
jgi:hypothetical protein